MKKNMGSGVTVKRFFMIEPCATAGGFEIKYPQHTFDLDKAEAMLEKFGPVMRRGLLLLARFRAYDLTLYRSGRIMMIGTDKRKNVGKGAEKNAGKNAEKDGKKDTSAEKFAAELDKLFIEAGVLVCVTPFPYD